MAHREKDYVLGKNKLLDAEKVEFLFQIDEINAEVQELSYRHRNFYVMEASEEVYQDAFSLDRLTQLVDVKSPNYVSQVLNEHYGRSFPTVVNEYRIREACRRINDNERYGNVTIEAIAQSVGFNAYHNFIANFKKFTGLTPGAYRKQGNLPA